MYFRFSFILLPLTSLGPSWFFRVLWHRFVISNFPLLPIVLLHHFASLGLPGYRSCPPCCCSFSAALCSSLSLVSPCFFFLPLGSLCFVLFLFPFASGGYLFFLGLSCCFSLRPFAFRGFISPPLASLITFWAHVMLAFPACMFVV